MARSKASSEWTTPGVARSRFATAVAVLGLLLGMPIATASADAFPLARTPHLPPSTTATMPEELRCDLDEDGNGLDDEMELSIARAAAPELRFDRNENAREADEPYTLFNIRRVPGRLGVLRIRYSLLFKRDGGAVYSALCGTAHNGDSESLTVDVKVTEGARRWVGEVVRVNGRTSFLRSGTHPVVFLSAGKKHQYFAAGLHRFGAHCPDGAGGDGTWVTPGTSVVHRVGAELVTTPHGLLFHVPLFFATGSDAAAAARDRDRLWKSNAPLFDDRAGWWNACLAGLHPTDRSRWRPAARFLARNSLAPVFPGETIEGDCFRGGLGGECTVADPVWFVMHDELADATDGDSVKLGGVLDADGDSRPEVTGLLSLGGSNFAFKATDGCPDDPRNTLPTSILERVAGSRSPSAIAFDPGTAQPRHATLPDIGLLSDVRWGARWQPLSGAPAATTAMSPAPWWGGRLGPFGGDDLRALGFAADAAVLFTPLEKGVRSVAVVALGEAAKRLGVTPVEGLLVPIAARPLGATNVIPDPDLLWVGRESVAARWVRLRPVSIGSGTILYDATDSGSIDATLSPSALLLADPYGESAAVVDPQSGTLVGFDPHLRTWVRSGASLAGVRDRVGAAWALRGGRVYAFGGRAAGGLADDGWAFDAFGEHAAHLDKLLLPPRENALLARSPRGWFYVGGIDSEGRAHDDVWGIAETGPGALGDARLFRADTISADAFSPATTLVAGLADGGRLRLWSARGALLDGYFRVLPGLAQVDVHAR